MRLKFFLVFRKILYCIQTSNTYCYDKRFVTRQTDYQARVGELMDHLADLNIDPVISRHLQEIEDLMSKPIPIGLGLSERYILHC